jgi:hypothetical protein
VVLSADFDAGFAVLMRKRLKKVGMMIKPIMQEIKRCDAIFFVVGVYHSR